MSLFTKILIAKMDEYARSGKAFTYRTIKEKVNPEVKEISGGSQSPRLDDRYFKSALLDMPIFSLPGGSFAAQPNTGVLSDGRMRIVAKVTDHAGKPIANALFGVFKAAANVTMGNIRRQDVLITGQTDTRGFFDSDERTLSVGTYKFKVVADGYRANIKTVQAVPNKNNYLVLTFKLERE